MKAFNLSLNLNNIIEYKYYLNFVKKKIYIFQKVVISACYINDKNEEKNYFPLVIGASDINENKTLEYIYFSGKMSNERDLKKFKILIQNLSIVIRMNLEIYLSTNLLQVQCFYHVIL